MIRLNDDFNETSLKNRLRDLQKIFAFSAFIPSYLKGGICQIGTEMREPRQNSERHSKVYRLAVPVLKSTQNLVISRVSCAGRAKKCTKKRELNLYFPIKHGFNEILTLFYDTVASSPQQSPSEKYTFFPLKKILSLEKHPSSRLLSC